MNRDALRQRLADLMTAATDGDVPAGAMVVAGASLTDLGVGSLGFLRFLDAVEDEFGVDVADDDDELPDTIDTFVDRLLAAGVPRPAAQTSEPHSATQTSGPHSAAQTSGPHSAAQTSGPHSAVQTSPHSAAQTSGPRS